MMELDDKTALIDRRRFSHLNLSTGQRKRMALLVTFLEDKPICVLDEWAADQDASFRHKFYHSLLEKLAREKEGRIVIVVTHDDRYFGAAPYLIRMEDGQARVVRRGGGGDDRYVSRREDS
jgi:putative ATP-binding cassette transporter